MNKNILALLIYFLSFPVFGNSYSNTEEESFLYSQSTYGSIGLIQTPTARFSEDGEFLFGFSSEHPYNRLFSKMQFFPWLEAVLRYTEETYVSYGNSGVQTNKDKGFDLKLRLLEEDAL